MKPTDMFASKPAKVVLSHDFSTSPIHVLLHGIGSCMGKIRLSDHMLAVFGICKYHLLHRTSIQERPPGLMSQLYLLTKSTWHQRMSRAYTEERVLFGPCCFLKRSLSIQQKGAALPCRDDRLEPCCIQCFTHFRLPFGHMVSHHE